MLNKLRKQCAVLINTDPEKYTLISEILNYESCFFEMDINCAYSILKDLKVQDKDLKKVYLELIKIENYNN